MSAPQQKLPEVNIDATLKTIANAEAKPEAAPARPPEYEFHPLADKFPLMEGDELHKLSVDIRDNGLQHQIVLYEGKILDGRNRYRAAKLRGFSLGPSCFRELSSCCRDPLAFVISMNIHRRHLTAEKKRELLAELIKIDPTKSNRQIAEEAKVSHHTVGEVREGLEATGQVAQLDATTGKDGKKRRTKGPKGKGKGGSKGKAITYAQVTDAKTATNAYSVLEEHLLDALQDLKGFSSFAHADEYAQGTIEKLQEKLNEMQPEEEEQEQEAA
jgi:hypothetical protein